MLLPLLSTANTVKKDKLLLQTNQAFIRVVPSKSPMYLGEAFEVSYILYCPGPAMEPEHDVNLQFVNCFAKEYGADKKVWTESINGTLYNAVVLKKYLLIPFKNGQIVFPLLSLKVKMTLPPAPDDFFQQEKIVTQKVVSEKKTIEIMPLPVLKGNLPFSNAVGSFKVKAVYKQSGGILKIKFSVDGTGNLKSFNLKFPDLPAGLESFDTEGYQTDTVLKDGWHSRYDFSCRVMASYKGNYHLPEKKFLVFNAAKRRYSTLTIPAYSWTVTKGPPMPKSLTAKPTVKKNVKPYLRISKGLDENITGKLFFNSPAFYIFILVSGMLFVSGWVHSNNLKEKLDNPERYYYKSAYKQAIKNIKKFQKTTITDGEYLKGTEQVLIVYLCHRYHIHRDEFSNDTLVQRLTDGKMPISARQQLFEILATYQQIRFSATKPTTLNRTQQARQLMDIIKQIQSVS